MNKHFDNDTGQQTTLLLMPSLKINFLKKTPAQKDSMPTHIAHICLCLLPHKPTQRQSQKSAIANALKQTATFQKPETFNSYF